MEKVKLPSMEHSFFFECRGSDTGEYYRGDFTYVRPNIGTQIEISKCQARYNGELQSIDDDIKMLNQMRAALLFCIKEAPDWWKQSNCGATLYDGNIVTELYVQCMRFEKEWHKKVWDTSEESKDKSPKE